MEAQNIKANQATINRPEGTRILDAPVMRINLVEAIPQIRNEVAYQNGDRNAITLLHNDYQRIVLVALKDSAEMTRHSVDGAISIHVLSGRLWVETLGASFSADEGEIIAIQPRIPHYVFAEKESTF